jgi:hypothetical protein
MEMDYSVYSTVCVRSRRGGFGSDVGNRVRLGHKSKTSLRIVPKFNQSWSLPFPGQLPKAARNVNIQLATTVLARVFPSS